MSGTYTITAEIEVINGDDANYPEVEIAFTHNAGWRGDWNDPGYGAEVEIDKVKLVNADGLALTDDQVHALGHAYIASDAGYRHACGEADSDHSFH